ncbi:response regulator [Gordonia pseudamarae]|jgi:two-component system OmpR family response regulator|uniref:Response regulator n=1 Tax=Gordonia pseudamarae TaxID=2831662 RepID=A0ABX6IPN4_9ACTN|nr:MULTISPECIES: response regulator transcription factor [Gordonia]MBD0020636.1 response regulator transcription factor [Gordonia sp. (in: high G+C Gram-positive bacteria)]QHN28806.1 response regulator [Gordonia pseudamarae]QHN37681.1 response regulator [Gordonia pseudamarae]
MRILLVEDDRNVAETVRRTLVSQSWVVEVTGDGESGLHKALSAHFDVVVLDIMLPGLNGYEVVRRMRAAKVWTPVLMLTAKSGEYDLADALDLGADDYLTKPFSVVVLIARLRALARRVAAERPTVLTAGDLRLDPGAHTVFRGDSELSLTPREFAVLEYLMRNRGQVCAKADILAAVWDAEAGGDDNLVEVYISYLRRRVDAPFGRRAIETVRGHGYRLAADGGARVS